MQTVATNNCMFVSFPHFLHFKLYSWTKFKFCCFLQHKKLISKALGSLPLLQSQKEISDPVLAKDICLKFKSTNTFRKETSWNYCALYKCQKILLYFFPFESVMCCLLIVSINVFINFFYTIPLCCIYICVQYLNTRNMN